MEVQTNEEGQMLIYLSEEEWRDYGRQAGFTPEIIKEASVEAEIEVEVEEEITVASLQAEIKEMKDKMASMENTEAVKKSAVDPNGGIGSHSVLIREDSSFNEENYPNLVAEQEREGLIGPFAVRH